VIRVGIAGTIDSTSKGDCVVPNTTNIANDYVAVWNENDPAERRRRIAAVWAPEGTSCFRLLDARGHDEIEGRVTTSWEKWLSEGKYRFRPKSVSGHNDAIGCQWEMIRLQDGAIEASGLSFLLVEHDGKLRHDYQFNPAVDDAAELTNRYLAVLNEPEPAARLRQIPKLWATNAHVFAPDHVGEGHAEVDAGLVLLKQCNLGAGQEFSPAGQSQRHHHIATFAWCVRTGEERRVVSAGSNLLIFDQNDQISRDYRFDDQM
jgi:hypothetical protein